MTNEHKIQQISLLVVRYSLDDIHTCVSIDDLIFNQAA